MNKIGGIFIILLLFIPGGLALAQTSQTDDQIYEFLTVDEKPVILNDVRPEYPESAYNAGIEGSVVVTVVIDKNGNVSDAVIFRSIPQLNAAALSAARRKTFSPGKLNGTAVITRMNIPIAFSLDDVPVSTAGQPTPTAASAPVGDIVDLSGSAVVIKAEPDRPRVNIISDRIKPRFDNINLEKSFVPELKGEGEHFVIRQRIAEEEFETVEVKSVLNKTR